MRGENGLLNAVRNAPQMVQELFDLVGIAVIDKYSAGLLARVQKGVEKRNAL
jgi:hypothetical protein